MSTVRATNFQNASSASTNITLDTAGNATVAGTMAMGSSFLRNRIINGYMMIDQRNAGASVTPTNTQYFCDRWWAWLSQASKLTTQVGESAPSYPAGFATALKVTSSSAYSVLSSDYFAVVQPIEGVNFYDLNWGTANAASATLMADSRAPSLARMSARFLRSASACSSMAARTPGGAAMSLIS